MSSVLVILESKNGEISRISWEALAAAHTLAAGLGLPLDAALIGLASVDKITGKPPRTLFTVDHALLRDYTADGFTEAYTQLIQHLKPAYVVLPHTYQVRDFAPALATRFNEVLISDVIGLTPSTPSPIFVRQLLQGKLNASYQHTSDGPCFLSVQAGAFRADASDAAPAAIESFRPNLEPAQIRTQPSQPFRASAQTVDLSTAAILVSVGRGIKEQANLPIVEELAAALGAELAASRPICDNGWLPMERQVGSSGQTVAPKVYLAIGISGAIQHLVGMKGSQCIVAINKDENAPIFEVADYGIVGDLFEIVPALTAAIRKAKP
ncbi:electron transfer flavoprotein subunit alpha/FixB family protein [Acidicapsa ligni]|uniref:electron transfer flavoprotein subunit alpha/FixB family protein n=1 Tax=Acidicapsa ligni TaxID=542300 RepID=UPI0021E04F8F|nr:electron transfer flavoprotein subunit alpha/FixB family protein [Acidicapsa ligni]